MQLTHLGNQDPILTGNPQITFFKAVYKRYTNFSIETLEIDIDGTLDFGNSLITTIPRSGDMINKMYFKIKLPSPSSVITATNFTYKNWINNVIFGLIEECTIEIGGTQIDQHKSIWFDIWNELTDEKKNLHHQVGKYPDNRILEKVENNETCYYLPLNFWFNREIGLSLPLIALQYHEVKLKIKLRKLQELLACDGSNISLDGSISEFKLYGDFIFLDEPERVKVASTVHKYLIEQVQTFEKSDINSGTNNVDFDFKHPIKELIWVFRNNSRKSDSTTTKFNLKINETNGNDIFNYNNTSINSTLGFNNYDHFSNINLELNGHDRFNLMDPLYFRNIMTENHHSCIPEKHIYVYSFCLKPESYQPSGTCNMSKMESQRLVIQDFSSDNFSITIFAINYNVLTIGAGEAYLDYTN